MRYLLATMIDVLALSQTETLHWFLTRLQNIIIYKPLAKSDDYLKWNDFL